jgi:hypothetical protein
MNEEINTEYENCLDMPNIVPTSLTDFIDESDIQIPEDESWKKHWKGMPEFKCDKDLPFMSLKINFRSAEDYKKFAELIEQKLTEKTKSIWYPIMHKEQNSLTRWVDEEE